VAPEILRKNPLSARNSIKKYSLSTVNLYGSFFSKKLRGFKPPCGRKNERKTTKRAYGA